MISSVLAVSKISIVKANPKTIVVPDDYADIQEAIDHASEGDTVFVKSKTYYNQTLKINKHISLVGEDPKTTRLLSPPSPQPPPFVFIFYNTIEILANNVTISGFTISAGNIGINGTGNGMRIIENNMTGYRGICLNGNHNIISGNTMSYSADITVYGSFNDIIGNRADRTEGTDIYLQGSFNHISENVVEKVTLHKSDSNTLSNNKMKFLWIGEGAQPCSNNTVYGNIIEGPYIWGILMCCGYNNVFYENRIANYSLPYGLGMGVALGGRDIVAKNNTFYRNTFVNNDKHVGYNWDISQCVNSWDNGFEGNYWDDYKGTDANGDGIGDTPYIINANNIDRYPLMKPIAIPEFPNMLISITLFMVMAIVVVFSRLKVRRKSVVKT